MTIQFFKHVRAIFIVLAVTWFAPHTHAYEQHDLTQIAQAAPGTNGHQLNVRLIDKVIQDLSAHAENYPPRFSSPAEGQLAAGEARKLSGMLNSLPPTPTTSFGILWRIARLNALAYNLDIKEAAQRADDAYKWMLARQPDHAGANYGYGLFLASSARPKLALPYMQAADQLGVDAAPYTLGLIYLSMNDRVNAGKQLTRYAQNHPDDQSVKKMIQALEAGSVRVQSK